MISTIGPARVPGIGGEFNAGDEDVLLFSATSLGETTSGSWELFYDGSLDSLGDDPAEGIDALWFQPGGEDFVFGTGAPVKMFGVQFGDGADLFRCNQFVREGQRHCGPNIFLDSSSKGFVDEVVDAFSVGDSGVLGDIGDGDDTEPGPPEDPDDAPNDLSSVFLPLVSR